MAGRTKLIMFEHFEKPMKTNLVIQSTSALSENVKVSSLSQEVVRILKNCSEDIDNSIRMEHLEKLCVKMKTSGFDNNYTRKILVNGIKCYERKLANSLLNKNHNKYKPLHLGKRYNASQRLENKLLAKSEWFKQKSSETIGDDQQETPRDRGTSHGRQGLHKGKVSIRLEEKCKMKGPSTVMFVPWTKRGKLAGAMKKEEDRLEKLTGFRIKFTEEGGTPLWMQFSTKLGGGGDCGRLSCFTCTQSEETKIDCFARSVVYESSCTICHPEGVTEKPGDSMVSSGMGLYTGETSRSLCERAGEHVAAAKGLERGSHMVKHWFLDHPGLSELPKFKFRIVGKYKDSMTRQIKEAIRVLNRPGNLNSKGEFGGSTIPRLVVEVTDYEKKKAEFEKRKREEEEDSRWMAFVESRDRFNKNPNNRVLPNWMLGGDTEAPLKRIKLESLPTSLQSDKSIMTKTDVRCSNPGWSVMTKTDIRCSSPEEGLPQCVSTILSSQVEGQLCIEYQEKLSIEYIEKEKIELTPKGASTTLQNEQNEQQNLVTNTPNQRKTVKVMGGRKGRGPEIMSVKSISEMFKNMRKNLPNEEPKLLVNSPKRKSTFTNSGLDSPSKKNCKKTISIENTLHIGTWSLDTDPESSKSESADAKRDKFGD